MSTSPTPCEDCQPPAPERAAPPAPAATLPDPSTFSPPLLSESSPGAESPRVVIEFCDRCRWLHRAVWTQTELFLTFPPAVPHSDDGDDANGSPKSGPGLKAITLLPRNSPETGGRFRVWLLMDQPQPPRNADESARLSTVIEGPAEPTHENWRGYSLVWDRKIEGGFPEMKVLKQRIRNLIAPQQDLGHSDKPAKSHQQAS
ncbi:hypothetical protein JCM11491_005468 [Sporobolomyces phaffii]